MHRRKRLVAWPLTCPWRLPSAAAAAAACRTKSHSTFTARSLHSTLPIGNSSFPPVAHETDLAPNSAPAEAVLPLQQKQRQHQDYRTRIHRSLDKLVLRDLSCLLIASGLPLTGTKPVLANRLVTHLASIMDKVDRLEPEFFLHNNSNPTTTTHSSLFSTTNRNSGPLPHSTFFSSTTPITYTTTTTDPATPQLHNHNNHQIDPDVLARIKDRILPRSIVSIDIGIRNLAWVELSKDGEILRWAVEDLLVPSPSSVSSGEPQAGLQVEEGEESSEGVGSSSLKKSQRRVRAGSNTKKKQRVKKQPAPAYDPRAVALRVDKVLRTILQGSESVQGIILERQRFRSGGMHTMLDSTFKCGVVEGMIHTWFAFWQHEQKRGQTVGSEEEQKEKEEACVFIESVPPRAVAVRWGIGASGAKASASSRKKKQALLLDGTMPDMKENHPVSDVVEQEEGESVRIDSIPSAQIPKSLTYRHKKVQSRAIVDNWIYSTPGVEEHIDTIAASVTTESPLPAKFRVRCSPEMREWYSQEQKRDDLSDCLLQAVAWFEWKGRAVQEAVERSMPRPSGAAEAAAEGTDDYAEKRQSKPRKRRSPGKAGSPSC
ncbi:mitochondrial resolvase Ydc2, partial [Linnemannia elongata]